MSSARMVTLFSDESLLARNRFSFLFSALVHGMAGAGLVAIFVKTPAIIQPRQEELFAVRLVRINAPDSEKRDDVSDALYDSLQAYSKEEPKRALSAAPGPFSPSRSPQLLLQTATASVQIPNDVVPNLIILAPQDIASTHVAAPELQREATADVRPVLELPNNEVALADVQIASSPSTKESLKLRSSTVTPIASHHPDQVQQLPQTHSSQSDELPTARIVSLSNIHIVEGEAAVPRVNSRGEGTHGDGTSGSSDGQNPGGYSHPALAGNLDGVSGAGSRLQTTTISLPRNGHFPMVMVGDSTGEKYPEANLLWKGRLAYTVYLPVGLPKNWILQYAEPQSTGLDASRAPGRLDAPWPIEMVVPRLDPDAMQSDALIVRGVINTAGRFEDLSVVFPSGFAQARFVLQTLQQWVFRSATQNGAMVSAEVVLIIPEQN